MPFKHWKELAPQSGNHQLRFMGDASVQCASLEGFYFNSNYGLEGSNENNVRDLMCGAGSNNCFVLAPGYTTADTNNANSNCINSNTAWWYDKCWTHNPTYTSYNHFRDTTTNCKSTERYTWYVR